MSSGVSFGDPVKVTEGDLTIYRVTEGTDEGLQLHGTYSYSYGGGNEPDFVTGFFLNTV